MAYTAMVFLGSVWFSALGTTILEALGKIQSQYNGPDRFTYRPSDGTIYKDNHIPCGVVYLRAGVS